MILDERAYRIGIGTCKQHSYYNRDCHNPFRPGSIEWQSFNRGYEDYYKRIFDPRYSKKKRRKKHGREKRP